MAVKLGLFVTKEEIHPHGKRKCQENSNENFEEEKLGKETLLCLWS